MFSTRGIQTAMSICNIFSICTRGKSYFHSCLYFRNFLWWRSRLEMKSGKSRKSVTAGEVPRGSSNRYFFPSIFIFIQLLLSVFIYFLVPPHPFVLMCQVNYIWNCVTLKDSNNVVSNSVTINPLNPKLNPICYLLASLGAHHFLHVSRIRVKLLTFRLLMSYIYGALILDVSRSHTTTQHSR